MNEELPEKYSQEALNTQPLEPLEPSEGIKRYIDRRRSEDVAPSTASGYETKLGYLQTFCENEGIANLNDLNGRNLDHYITWRRQHSTEGELSSATMKDDCYLLHNFLEYLASINAVKQDLCSKIKFPDTEEGSEIRNIELSEERTREILEHLEKYEYASREHVVVVLKARLGARPSCVYAIDLGDVHLDTNKPYIEFRNRPQETRLKKGNDGERQVSISNSVREILKDYIDKNRIEVTSEAGREPLLTTSYGRLAKSTMRKYVYKWTCPCKITEDCPHGRDLGKCEAGQKTSEASTCPSSVPPYALRHGYISYGRRNGISKALLSDRCDVSEEILEKHYDERTEEEKREARRKELNTIQGDTGGGYFD